ncbi:MAG: hypothetical protein JWM12_45, partial [Ilumatobacteraceae bacterium]|nr:hypothetical protein [Ilumatobacteraceae bacterium]
MTPAGTGGLDDVDPASTIDVDPASTIDTGEIPVTPATTTDTDQVPVDPVTGWPRDRPRRRPARSRRQRIAIHLLIVIVTVLAFVLALGAGWFGDVFGLAMPVVLAASVLVAVAVLVAWRPLSTMPVTLVVLSAFVVFAPRWPHRTPAPVGPVHLAAVNLKFDSEDAVGGVRDALAVDADVLVVSELTPDTDRLLQVQYPYRIVTDDLLRDDRFGEGVYSKLPLTLLATPTAVVGQLLRVSVGGATPFVLYAAHLSRPT